MEDIKKYLENADREIFTFDVIDSTNSYAKNIALNGAAHGTIVTADSQTSGRGRLGRNFFSPHGTSIYMTVILRMNMTLAKAGMITPLAAVAASRAVDKLSGTDTRIKWVNDLYLNKKKFCGILAESIIAENGMPKFSVLGIGLNVRSVKNIFPKELLETATSIEDETGKIISREKLTAEIINELDRLLPELENGSFMEEYRKRSCVIGCYAQITKHSGKMAKICSISDSGALIVEYDDKTTEKIDTGEAVISKESLKAAWN